MSKLLIEGGHRLNGEMTLQGAKNSVLPILAACLLCEGTCVIHNCPDLTDVHASGEILRSLGCSCNYNDGTMTVCADNADRYEIDDRLMCSMRSSVLFLGALLSRFSRAVISIPGGCELGLRPINLHLDAFRRMGAEISEEHGHIYCHAPNGLAGCVIDLPIASVGATENIMIAASTAKGTTVIRNAAKEPEISDLAGFLRSMGAKITGDSSTVITIDGVPSLHGCEHTVIPDRIAGITYMCATALCGGTVKINNINEEHLVSVLPRFEEMGCDVCGKDGSITVRSNGILHRIKDVSTKEYPGFPTDAQPILLAAVTKAHGTSLFVENIFSNRYKYVEGLLKMGANIKVIDRVAVVEGVPRLTSADVDATDLRGGAALVLAALVAEGRSVISQVCHIDRGYENIEQVLTSRGANIKRENERCLQGKNQP